jgi:two-component system response regulator AtoC
MSQDLKILIVEDDADFRRQTARSLLPLNDITEAESLAQARQALQKHAFDVIILDRRLPDGEAHEILEEISTSQPSAAVLILTGDSDQTLVRKYMAMGAHDYVQKTENAIFDLKIRIPAALATIALQRKSKALEDSISASFRHEIVGKSEATRHLRERILSLKGSNIPILITGESGTGKENIAQMIHRTEGSNRRPFVAVNCGALAEHLVESELFGHRRGAFTGAATDQIGKFELAHQGDIFLDEIGDLPLAAQVKLLRVLQEGEFYRVGDSTVRRVSVRVIAATNRDLAKMVTDGTFRKDLYYRLNVISLKTTPLRERPEDIEDIARFLITVHGRGRFSIDPTTLKRLGRYSWPGNVRELSNSIERAMIEAKIRGSHLLEAKDLLPTAYELDPGQPVSGGSLPSKAEQVTLEGLEEYIKRAEREYLGRALSFFGGSVGDLARHLNYSRSTLFKRIAALNLPGNRPGLSRSSNPSETTHESSLNN